MEFASCGAEMIVKCAVKAGWERLRYAVYYRRNIRELRGKLDLLVDRQSSVHRQIEEARRNGEMIEDEVQNWMDAVNEMTERAQEMYENEREERESRCPNPMSRYRLGRRATELATEVDTRFNQSFARISYPQPLQQMTDMAIIGESSEGFDSRVSIVNEIMEALRDPNVKRIGLCGIGGVGKTATAKEVARKVKADMFNTVVMVQVTENPNHEKIQREIAGKVGMTLDDKETEDVRATRLCARLKQETNMLLILDDLWEKLQFHKIGIPSDSRVLLTSRMDRLLADQMECKKVIKVDVMSEDEAWKLFIKEIAELPDDNEIRSIAKEIVGRCGRLPVRIVAAAGTLKNKKIDEWRDVLQRLKSPLQRNNTGIEEADGIFKVSYDRLSQESKPIFLLSAMLSHNPLIKDLMMCSVGLDLLQGVNTMEGALVRIHSLINQLKASNLLLDSSDNSHFAIHDVIRDVALSIASHEEPALVLRNERLNRWLDKNLQKKCRSMCLDNCDINNLPQELSCPNLQFFLLNSKNSDLMIPTTFFLSTNKLKVMGFSDMHFSCLPSLQSLQDELQTLYLHSCALEDITEVGSLKSLTILSLAHSRIKQLPLELSQLTSLQMLNLAFCSELEVIPPKLLSSLKRLEVLDMRNSFKQWETEGDNKENENASLDELKHLTNLSSLAIQIPDVFILPKDLFKDIPLERYEIVIGKQYYGLWSDDYQTTLSIRRNYLADGIQKRLELAGKFAMMIWNAQFPVNLFQTVQHLCLLLAGSVSFARGLHNNRFPNLQVLDLSGSFTSLKEFIPTQSLNEHSQQAQNLQILILSYCCNLINMGPSLISFANLIDIRVLYCKRMTSLMTPSTSRSLVQLTELTIMNCYEMEEIIRKQEGEEEDDGEKEIVFPKLESLKLDELVSLRSFCSHNYTLSFPSLQKVSIEKCERMSMFCPGDIQTPSLKCVTWQGIKDEKLVDNNLNKTIQHLFSSQVSIPERMVIEDSNDLNLWIWDDQFPQNKFANLKTLIVKRCGFVERLVPFRILKSLTNLEELEVHECESLEIVFDLEELNNDEKDTHQLPWVVPLKKLELRRLPKLKHVWSNDPQEMVSFHSLQEVEALYCEKLTSMFPASIAERCFLQLEKLTIHACGINAIVAKELYVSFCDELEMFPKQVSSSSILEDEGHDTYPLFFQEKVVDNLKMLDLGGKLAMMIWNGQFPEKLFQNVQELSLHLNGSISFAHGLCNDRLPNLQELNLIGWVKEFMPLLVDVAPSKLTKLVLVCVNCLKHIWNEHSQQNSLLQNIQTLEVKFCSDLINLGTSFIPFTNLTNIHVSESYRLTSLLTSSTSRNLVQLTRLRISDCDKIEEITTKQEGEGEDDVEKEIVFQKLESLTLEHLPRLRSFCDHNYTFRFPSLEEVIIRGCERMSMFCPGNIHTPLLKCVNYGEIEDEKLLDSNLNNTIQLLLTQVTKLELHPEMRNIWMEKLPHHMPFSRLEHLIVDNCDFLSEYAIPTHLIRFLSKLKVLEVCNCHAIKTIFDLKGTDLDEETHKLVANIHLKKLKLHNLPNLKSVWIQDLDGSTCFQYLEELYVGECESLRNIFVASVAKRLGQLKKLSIESCGVEEIIAKDEASKESPNFVLPQLNYLKLDKLPNLKCFYPKRCLFEWPQLTDLFVSQCGNVDVFGTEITSNIESDEEDEVETQLPLFSAEKVIPKLESLSLSQQDIVTLERNGQAELFHEVQKLCLESFLGELITFPYDFLGRFPNLNELIVNHCSFEEIFPSHVQAVDDIEEIASFNILCLAYLDQLKTIWNDDVDSQLPPLSQNLERLEVECCCSLVKLTPSSASLENLTHLKVSACHQLTYLVTNSTAKSLVNLSKLVIKDCEKMEEIITNENNDAEGKITFNELEGLELTNLPILKSFCLENQSFKFPKLDSLTISGCHQMKMFCHGVVKTPQLEFVIAEERIFLLLERDLNKTIELLISNKDG